MKVYSEETKEFAVRLTEQGVSLTQIAKQVGAGRETIKGWLEAAGVEPVLQRRAAKNSGGSVRNTPLALSIEESVRKRLQEREESDDARA